MTNIYSDKGYLKQLDLQKRQRQRGEFRLQAAAKAKQHLLEAFDRLSPGPGTWLPLRERVQEMEIEGWNDRDICQFITDKLAAGMRGCW